MLKLVGVSDGWGFALPLRRALEDVGIATLTVNRLVRGGECPVRGPVRVSASMVIRRDPDIPRRAAAGGLRGKGRPYISATAPGPVPPWCATVDTGWSGAYLGGMAAMPQSRRLPASEPRATNAGFPCQSPSPASIF